MPHLPPSTRAFTTIALACLLVLALEGTGQGQAPSGKPTPAKETQARPGAEGEPQVEDASELVLVKGDGFEISVGDVRAELQRQAGRLRYVRDNPEALREFVEHMVRRELLAREAERRGYGKDPAVLQATKEEAVQELNRSAIDEKLSPTSIPEAEVAAYYEAHSTQYKRPAMRRARHILLEKKSEANELLAAARGADEREFQRLAREHSIDTETKQRGGDLRFFAREDDPKRREAPVHEAIRAAAFKLAKLGDTVKAPVEVDGRYSIVRLTGIREARETTLAQAEASIRTRLWREQRRNALKELIARLRAELKPEVFEDRVLAIDLSDVGARPGGFLRDRPRRTEKAKPKATPKPAEDER